MIGFGIDLAGYTTGKTSLAVIKIDGRRATATLLRGSALSVKRESHSLLKDIIKQEVAALRRCLKVGPVAVDIPIDLQDLPFPHAPNELWELTKRPIDKKLHAMAPFADRIGAPVVRFATIMREGNFSGLLGERLFEAYPKASLKRLTGKRWQCVKGYKKDPNQRASACEILKIAPVGEIESDDDVDAIVCAVTAVGPGHHLCRAEDYGVENVPRGFRLLKENPLDEIRVVGKADFSEWIESCERQE